MCITMKPHSSADKAGLELPSAGIADALHCGTKDRAQDLMPARQTACQLRHSPVYITFSHVPFPLARVGQGPLVLEWSAE